MSNDTAPTSDRLPGRFAAWLQALSRDRPGVPLEDRSQGLDRAALLQQAARSYAMAGWADDAARTYEVVGDFHRAGPFHEQQGRWKEAALCYDRAGDWTNAARCHLAAGQADAAADCLIKVGQPLRAAWTFAHLAGHYRQAQSIVASLSIEGDGDRRAIALITARCEAGAGHPVEAAQHLRQVIDQFQNDAADAQREHIEWAFAVADFLQRPDLAALLYASGVAARRFGAQESWRAWADQTLGDSTGVPVAQELDSGEPNVS